MTDTGTRVPLIVNWPAGIKKPGRITDELVEFTDMMPTLCEISGASLPTHHPSDGASIVPVLTNKKNVRKKDWIYIWYRDQVMVRNKKYSVLAKQDGSNSRLTRYKGQFDGKELNDQKLTKAENTIKKEFAGILAKMAKTRLSTASAEGKKGGQFYTPSHVVKTLVAVLSPDKGRVYDPCCGSGGMFVQSENVCS